MKKILKLHCVRSSSWPAALVAALLACCPESAVAGSTNLPIPYAFRAWQTDEGLPQNSVHAIAQTSDGFLWVGTEDGLARFDGVRFSLPDDQALTPLRHVTINALLGAKDGSLWIGTAGFGLIRWQSGTVEHWSKTNGLPDDAVHCLLLASDGSLWIGTDQGASQLRDGKLRTFKPPKSQTDQSVSAIGEDANGVIRVASPNGMWSVDKTGRASDENFGIGPIRYGLKTVYSGRGGNFWFGGSGGLRYVNVANTNPAVRSTELRQQIVSVLTEDSLGQRWVGTFRGVVRMMGDQVVDWPLNEGTTGDRVYAIFEDREGDIWVGGRDGLYRLTPSRFANYTAQQGLVANDVMSVCEDKTGAIWVASWVAGLSRIYGGTVSIVRSTNGLTDDSVLSLHPARDGGLWVGMDFGRGLDKLDKKNKNVFTPPPGLINAAIRAIYEQADGTLWIGTGKGLNVLRNGQIETYTSANGLAGDNVMAIIEDAGGTIWIGTVGGISQWSNGRFKNITTREGLSHNFVSAFHEDANHDIWVGTKGGGLNRWRAGKINSYTTRDGLFSDEIFEILEDDLGYFWMSCRRGVFRISRRQFDDFDAGTIRHLNCTAFGREDGMATVQCNGVAKPAGWKSSDGRLWFATIRGVVAIEPRIKTNEQQPPVQIEEILADRQPLRPARAGAGMTRLDVPASTREIEIHFTALSFQAPEKNRFRYKLKNIDSDWVDAGPRRVANYYLIHPGSYRFEVAACNNDGVWNETGAAVELVVQPHYWQTWPFKTAVVLTPALILIAYFRSRVARLREIEQLRIRIASDLHDDVGSRLTKVAMVTESLNVQTPPSAPGKSHVENIAGTVRDITLAMDEIVWTINPRNDTLDNLANYIFQYAQDYFQNTPVRCRLDLPPELPDHPISTEQRHNLFMAVKEALNNVLKHSHATEVHISLAVTGDLLTIKVADNGRGGIPPEAGASGNGLVNMKQRLHQLGGRLDIDSKPGSGTTVTLELAGRWSD